MPEKTTEEKAQMRAALEEQRQKGVFEKARQDDLIEQAGFDREIEMLQRRVKTEYEMVDLGHGDLIKIRTRVSLTEGRRILDLMKISQSAEATPEQRMEADAEVLATATLNPALTKEWFLENPDKWSSVDSIPIIVTLFETVDKKVRQVSQAAAFRREQAGAGPGRNVALPPGAGPQKMG